MLKRKATDVETPAKRHEPASDSDGSRSRDSDSGSGSDSESGSERDSERHSQDERGSLAVASDDEAKDEVLADLAALAHGDADPADAEAAEAAESDAEAEADAEAAPAPVDPLVLLQPLVTSYDWLTQIQDWVYFRHEFGQDTILEELRPEFLQHTFLPLERHLSTFQSAYSADWGRAIHRMIQDLTAKWTLDYLLESMRWHIANNEKLQHLGQLTCSVTAIRSQWDFAFDTARLNEYGVTTLFELFRLYQLELEDVKGRVRIHDREAERLGQPLMSTEQLPSQSNVTGFLTRLEMILTLSWQTHGMMLYSLNKIYLQPEYTVKSERLQNPLVNIRILCGYNPNDDSGASKQDGDKIHEKSRLLIFYMNQFQLHEFAYAGESLYEPIRTRTGFPTRAWKRRGLIADALFQFGNKEMHFDIWQILVRSNPDDIAKTLRLNNDPQFPQLCKHRHVMAFRNGLYITHVQSVWPSDEKNNTDAFYSFDQLPKLDPSIAAAKYHDADFVWPSLEVRTTEGAWYGVATPALQSILDYQFDTEDEHEEICRMLYRLLGRLLHPTGKLDNWQVWPYFKGIAGTGKSTIVNLVAQFFDKEDIGMLSSDAEKTYALSGFADKMMVIAPEMGVNCEFPQTTLMSMISGEDVGVSEKYKNPRMQRFSAPGICAGNADMGGAHYKDTAGNLARRFMQFMFKNIVRSDKLDMRLADRLKAELPVIMFKCNHAYLEWVNKFGDQDLFSAAACCEYFRLNRKEYQEDMDPLISFMQSDHIVYAADAYMPLEIFKTKYRELAAKHASKQPKDIPWNSQDMVSLQAQLRVMSALKGFPIVLNRGAIRRKYPRGSAVDLKDKYIDGIDCL